MPQEHADSDKAGGALTPHTDLAESVAQGVCATECGLGSVVRIRASKARPAPPWFDATRGFGATLLARIRAVLTESHSVAQAPSHGRSQAAPDFQEFDSSRIRPIRQPRLPGDQHEQCGVDRQTV